VRTYCAVSAQRGGGGGHVRWRRCEESRHDLDVREENARQGEEQRVRSKRNHLHPPPPSASREVSRRDDNCGHGGCCQCEVWELRGGEVLKEPDAPVGALDERVRQRNRRAAERPLAVRRADFTRRAPLDGPAPSAADPQLRPCGQRDSEGGADGGQNQSDAALRAGADEREAKGDDAKEGRVGPC
jgi:hypothetical protein